MRGFIALVLTVVAASCAAESTPTELDPILGTAGSEAVLSTDRESYAAGETVVIRLKNVFEHSLGYNLCTSMMEQRAGGGWRPAEFGNGRICTMELRILEPGRTATFGVQLDAETPAGEYRFRTRIENMRNGSGEQAATNPFRVTR